jgi:DNA-binding response OmpR family regulator
MGVARAEGTMTTPQPSATAELERGSTVVLIHDDAQVADAAGAALRDVGCHVVSFVDRQVARPSLDALIPDLLVADYPFPPGEQAPGAPHVPWIALVPPDDPGAVIDALEDGADDCVRTPPEPALLAVKVRAALRRAARAGGPGADRRGRPLMGEIKAAGVLPLLKFCEDHHLTGRLTVDLDDVIAWVDFRGGELWSSGVRPPSGVDPLEILMHARSGRYVIEQASLDAYALAERLAENEGAAPPVAAAPPAAPPPAFVVPSGRLSAVPARGGDCQVQTEAANDPNFVVTTIVSRDGRVVRKIRKEWQHRLRRAEDVEVARRAIDAQHDGVTRRLREALAVAAEGGSPRATAADGALLAWALHLVGERVWTVLGTTVTRSLLERTREAVASTAPAAGWFHVTPEARVEIGSGPAPAGALAAAAEWTARFLREARRTDESAHFGLREATAMMAPALERAGFYRAVEEAARRTEGTGQAPRAEGRAVR